MIYRIGQRIEVERDKWGTVLAIGLNNGEWGYFNLMVVQLDGRTDAMLMSNGPQERDSSYMLPTRMVPQWPLISATK
jgi:hypothetical protein